MSKLDCNCLCHGTDGNIIADQNFACKLCYAACHMGHLRHEAHEDAPRPKKKKFVKKPKAPIPAVQTTVVSVAAVSENE